MRDKSDLWRNENPESSGCWDKKVFALTTILTTQAAKENIVLF